ncbi:MAG: patatin-like phospholipase family protein [Flavobacteriaceae bacterium]
MSQTYKASAKSGRDAQPAPKNRDDIILVLQGGGALGAYQAGAYEALADAGYAPERIAGISIGAINGAIIAGNPPERRVERLRRFWQRVSSRDVGWPLSSHGEWRNAFAQAAAFNSLLCGVPGFFTPRIAPPLFAPAEDVTRLGYYDTEPLRETLSELVDFDYLNSEGPRLSVGAVNIRSGNFAYFDCCHRPLSEAHIMASAALPPGLPPVEIDGEYYWDGGIVSNTPLHHVLDSGLSRATTVFQVDLFSARGTMPGTLADAVEREKEIRYSSRTRDHTRQMAERLKLRSAFDRLLDKLPPELAADPDVDLLRGARHEPAVTIMHLIYRDRAFRSHARDYEFSRRSVEEHWAAGKRDVQHSLGDRRWRERAQGIPGVTIYDLTKDMEGQDRS